MAHRTPQHVARWFALKDHTGRLRSVTLPKPGRYL